jgi:RibD C-terminal domain
MTMSLGGCVAGPQDSTEEPMGIGEFGLFSWLDHRLDPGPDGRSGVRRDDRDPGRDRGPPHPRAPESRRGDHHDGVPLFVLTPPVPEEPTPGGVRSVTDVHACAAQARAAAGDADVLVSGAGAAQSLLRAGELDEMELHVVPVLLGRGRRLFDHLAAERIELGLTRELNVADADPADRVLHLRYRVQRPPATKDPGGNR